MKKGLLICFSCLVASPSMVLAQEIFTFQDGVSPSPAYEGTQDAHIISWDNGDGESGEGGQSILYRSTDPEFPDELGQTRGANPAGPDDGNFHFDNAQNMGATTEMEEGDNDAGGGTNDSKSILVQFKDLEQTIPTSRAGEITSARIGLTFSRLREGDAGDPHPLYVTRVLKQWEQGDGDAFPDGVDTPDNSGAVTWNSTGFELWQALGAEGPEDVAPPESESFIDLTVINTLDIVWFDVTESAKIWIADPSQNNGVKLSQNEYPDGTTRQFLEPDLALPDGTMIYSSDPVADPTHFVDARIVFFTSEHDFPDERPILEVTLNGQVTTVPEWSLY